MLFINRKSKKVNVAELIKDTERRTHKNVQHRILKAMISVYPSHYIFSITEDGLVIEINTSDQPVTLATIDKRKAEFENELFEAFERKDKYIDLISFPELEQGTKEYNVLKEDDKNEGNIDADLYSCAQCEKVYYDIKKLKSHFRIRHTDKKKYACQFCGKSYSKKYRLKSHIILKRTRGKPFKCT